MILPVNLYGSVVDVKKIKKIIGNKKIFIIEDSAQAHGERIIWVTQSVNIAICHVTVFTQEKI